LDIALFKSIPSQPPQQGAVLTELGKAHLYTLTGVLSGSNLLTPDSVKWFPSLSLSFPRYEHSLKRSELKDGPRLIHGFIRNAYGSNHSLGIQSWTPLPDVCCACLKPVHHYEVCQVSEVKTTVKVQVSGVDQATVDRIATAWSSMRTWIPVPFCAEHSLDRERPVEIQPDGDKFTVRFKNGDYSRLFSAQHNSPGKYVEFAHAIVDTTQIFLFLVFFGLMVFGGLMTYDGLAHVTANLENALWIGLGFLGAGLLVGGLDLLWYRHTKKLAVMR
jgi:hypothetical protein